MSRDSRCSCCRLRTEGAWEGDEKEMFRLQDRTDLISDVSNRTLTLIEREDDTMSWSNFLIYFSHNVIPT
jgi:hypothetical protein